MNPFDTTPQKTIETIVNVVWGPDLVWYYNWTPCSRFQREKPDLPPEITTPGKVKTLVLISVLR